MATTENPPKKARIFGDIDAEEQECTEMESLCMNCGQNGVTRMLLTSIPHFREVILMAFECPRCHERNNEIQSGGAIQPRGVHISCTIATKEDLNRQVIKSEHAAIRVEELDFEIPAGTQRGLLNTVEGFLAKAADDLAMYQAERQAVVEPQVWEKINATIEKLREYASGNSATPFTLTVDDPSGNSYVENLVAPSKDPNMTIDTYMRTAEQSEQVGLDPANDKDDPLTEENLKDEVLSFPTNCSNCHAPSDCKMKIVDIPYFKQVVLMAITCDTCGFKSTEVKAGGAIAEKGTRITLKMTESDDLSRDILKSESCGFSIPEIDLQLDAGTLGGKFTTVEGLLQNIYDELSSRGPFARGDSLTSERRERFATFLERLKSLIAMEQPFTIVMDDPLGNSYLQNLFAPDPDPNMLLEHYERTEEQNDFLGISDMDTGDVAQV